MSPTVSDSPIFVAPGATLKPAPSALPPNLPQCPYSHLDRALSPGDRKQRLAQIIKFALPGTDMPGHEYFSDSEIASISLWLAQNAAPPTQHQ